MRNRSKHAHRTAGFTLIELLIVSLIMLVIIGIALSIYAKGNKTAADQQQYTRLQQDARAAMYYLARDVRMAGTGLPSNFLANALEGADNENQGGTVQPDRLKILGNIETPFALTITSVGGQGVTINLQDFSLEQFPYPESYYIGKNILVLPSPASTCVGAALRTITSVDPGLLGISERFQCLPNQGINLPGGLQDICDDAEFDGGSIIFADVREFWLDVTGNAPGLTAGLNGYIGGGMGGVLYLTNNGSHLPLAQNIENIQFQYNGNFDGDTALALDGFADWNSAWTPTQVASIRQVRIWVLGRTEDRFVSIPALPSRNTYLYRRPAIANSPAADTDDWHKRFLLDSTSNIRNMSLDVYNRVQR
ncbi:MAG: prepilin-type N-terminal cleavage/methylation domain-containing protein [Candidatus Aminicenantes bacterium]|nr:prepilin-type N-terminal cleavage/methylation domain-containing protein [Candidatus Aminicenantes bacterium]